MRIHIGKPRDDNPNYSCSIFIKIDFKQYLCDKIDNHVFQKQSLIMSSKHVSNEKYIFLRQ